MIQYGSSANLCCTWSCFMLRFSLYCLFCFSPPFPFLLLCLHHHHHLLLLLWVLISFYVMECWWVVLSLITANSIIKSLHDIFYLLFLKSSINAPQWPVMGSPHTLRMPLPTLPDNIYVGSSGVSLISWLTYPIKGSVLNPWS